jgi:hypothetical protein
MGMLAVDERKCDITQSRVIMHLQNYFVFSSLFNVGNHKEEERDQGQAQEAGIPKQFSRPAGRVLDCVD